MQQRQELQKVYQYERVNMIYSLSTVFNHTLTNEQDNERMNMAHNRVNIIYGYSLSTVFQSYVDN